MYSGHHSHEVAHDPESIPRSAYDGAAVRSLVLGRCEEVFGGGHGRVFFLIVFVFFFLLVTYLIYLFFSQHLVIESG